MKKHKYKIAAVLVALSLLTLTACVRANELDEQIIVQTVGIDQEIIDETREIKKFVLSVQYVENRSGNSQTGEMKVYTAKGAGLSMSAAAEQIEKELGRTLFFRQNQVIILGIGVIDNRVTAALEEYTQMLDRHPDALVGVTLGKAADIILAESEVYPVTAQRVYSIIQKGKKSAISSAPTVMDINNRMYNGTAFFPILTGSAGQSAVNDVTGSLLLSKVTESTHQTGTPRITYVPELMEYANRAAEKIQHESNRAAGGGSEKEEASKGSQADGDPIVSLGGGMLVCRDRIILLDNEICKGISICRNNAKMFEVTFPILEEDSVGKHIKLVTMETVTSHVKITPKLSEENKLSFDINLSGVFQMGVRHIGTDTVRTKSTVEKAANAELCRLLTKSVENSAKRYGADSLYFSQRVRAKYPKFFNANEENLRQMLLDAEYTVVSDMKFERFK